MQDWLSADRFCPFEGPHRCRPRLDGQYWVVQRPSGATFQAQNPRGFRQPVGQIEAVHEGSGTRRTHFQFWLTLDAGTGQSLVWPSHVSMASPMKGTTPRASLPATFGILVWTPSKWDRDYKCIPKKLTVNRRIDHQFTFNRTNTNDNMLQPKQYFFLYIYIIGTIESLYLTTEQIQWLINNGNGKGFLRTPI